MNKFLRILIPLFVLLLIGGSILLSNLPAFQQYSYVKNNLNTPTKISFWKNYFKPMPLGQKDTVLLAFKIKSHGPSTISFDQPNSLKVTLYAKNNSAKDMKGNSSCVLRDHASPAVTYASVSDWTAAIDGSGVRKNHYEIDDIIFNNFGSGKNSVLTIPQNGFVDVELACDTTNFISGSNPSTMSANILTPNYITYRLTDPVALKNRDNLLGLSQIVSGLPIKGQDLRTAR